MNDEARQKAIEYLRSRNIYSLDKDNEFKPNLKETNVAKRVKAEMKRRKEAEVEKPEAPVFLLRRKG